MVVHDLDDAPVRVWSIGISSSVPVKEALKRDLGVAIVRGRKPSIDCLTFAQETLPLAGMNEVAKKVRAKCMTSLRIDDHKVSFTLGNELIVVCPAHFSCHAGNVTTAFDAPRSKADGSACRERRFVTKIAPAGDGPMSS